MCNSWAAGTLHIEMDTKIKDRRNKTYKPSRLMRGVWERFRLLKQPDRAAQHLEIVLQFFFFFCIFLFLCLHFTIEIFSLQIDLIWEGFMKLKERINSKNFFFPMREGLYDILELHYCGSMERPLSGPRPTLCRSRCSS